jgi:D-alanine-D-alanine ligase
MKIGVLYGGTSAEREVSLSSGKGIIAAVKSKGHEVIEVDFHPERLEEVLALKDVDFVFIALHGRFGEDGRVQGLLDMLGTPYVGSGVLGSALAMDKARAKTFFRKVGIRVAEEKIVYDYNYSPLEFSLNMEYPVVVKPNQEGSTIGLTIAKNEEELHVGIKEALRFDNTALIEEFIQGREVTVAVMGNKGSEKALPVIEIVHKNAYYDYESKYAPGMSEHICPAKLDESTTSYLQNNAVLAHQASDCNVYSRVDFIVPNDGSDPVILEVNTLPGMTPTSLYPEAASEIGLSYQDMIEELIRLSLKK